MALDANESFDKSVLKFESMLKTDEVYFFDAEDFEIIIEHYLNAGKIALGKKAIQLGLQQHPHAIELKLLRVEVLVFEDQFEKAEVLLDELQSIDSNNEEIYIQRANIYSRRDNHLEAVNLLLEALHIAEESYDIHALLGMEYLFMDDYAKAKKSFMKCVSYDEQDYASLYNVMYCFEFLEDFEGGIYYLNDYLDRNPYCEVAWHQLGKMYYALRMFKEALTAYDFAIIADEIFIGAYFEKGKVLEKLGRFNEAIECYETTMKIDTPTSHAYLRIGKCHEKLGNDELAKYYYYNTVHEDPLLDKGWLAITNFYYKQQDYKKALHYVNKAINIDGQNPQYWKICAKTYNALNELDEADFAFKQTIELGNYEKDSWIDWADVLKRINDLSTAINVLKQGLEFFPEDADLHFMLAGMYLMLGNNGKAQESFGAAIQINAESLPFFNDYFPDFKSVKWVREIASVYKKAST